MGIPKINSMEQKKQIFTARKNALSKFLQKERRMPTFEEMRCLFLVSSKNAVAKIINKFEEAKIVEKTASGKLVPGSMLTGIKKLGTITAGFPSGAEEEIAEAVNLNAMLVKNPESSFMLTVSGDSMIEAGINPGDLVIVDRSAIPKNGDIVVANVDSDWTLKYFERSGKTVKLIPANKKYRPITPSHELAIGGVAVAVIRKY